MPETEAATEFDLIETLYYFNGESGCDQCQSMTGFYLDVPLRPHPYCNCTIEAYGVEPGNGENEAPEIYGPDGTAPASYEEAGLGSSRFGGGGVVQKPPTCHIELRNPTKSRSRTNRTIIEPFDNCGQPAARYTMNLAPDEDDNLSQALKMASGWSPPNIRRSSATALLPANSKGEIEFFISRVVDNISADRWEVCSDGTEKQIGRVSGTYAISVSIIVLNIDARKCK